MPRYNVDTQGGNSGSPMDQTGIPVDVVARNPESRLDPGGGRPDLGRNPVRCAFQPPIDAFCRRRPRRRVLNPFDTSCRRLVPRRVRGPRGLGDTGHELVAPGLKRLRRQCRIPQLSLFLFRQHQGMTVRIVGERKLHHITRHGLARRLRALPDHRLLCRLAVQAPLPPAGPLLRRLRHGSPSPAGPTAFQRFAAPGSVSPSSMPSRSIHSSTGEGTHVTRLQRSGGRPRASDRSRLPRSGARG